ncbi:putative ph domain protein [Erysiphe necator]|uniref:Putative ph domain protein n=1 Tax=Uncinula necator TaxID=52586 RepID=A0A0B1P5M1_UNCNE|nr:putative ph domain protein [Erysiphe necator]
MGNRSRVLSFISNFSSSGKDGRNTPTPASQSQPNSESQKVGSSSINQSAPDLSTSELRNSQQNLAQEHISSSSKPMSMLFQTYKPPILDTDQNTLPELQPIFTLLNDHANKLYQEGYFLKLDDQNTQGKPNPDRIWTECFAQLVGTVLSLWDAAELDIVGQDGEVLPKFINLSDASIKMIESLSTRSQTDAPLQNVLSISTAGKNRYLLHFNSHHSLIQWTAGIRLAMYEHATLQEAYTGALIAGKGKSLNNINAIMDRSRSPTADWARVRFGAGTPWRRCWCVISPADEKEVIKWQKQWKKSPYDRSRPPTLKGVIKFYHSKKTKKTQPIATISDAYSAFAIYPQSKPLIDASTLVKVEGSIIIHSTPPSTTEGFVFVMPETHPAVTGFEMMLRWLFPVFDTFGLYGRPGRLVAATEDVRSLMFAMPTQRRHGYLEIIDVVGLILEEGSLNWKESQWRKRMKELTAKRMIAIESDSRADSRLGSRRGARNSMGPSNLRNVKFDAEGDKASVKSTPSTSRALKSGADGKINGSRIRTDSAPSLSTLKLQSQPGEIHNRSESELDSNSKNMSQLQEIRCLSTCGNTDQKVLLSSNYLESSIPKQREELDATYERVSSEDEQSSEATQVSELQELKLNTSPEPVAAPPAFVHGPGSLPLSKPYHSPELRRANSRISSTTLNQLTSAHITQVDSLNREERFTEKDMAFREGEKNLDSTKENNSVNESARNLNVKMKKLSFEKLSSFNLVNSNDQTLIPQNKASRSSSSLMIDKISYSHPPPNKNLPLNPTEKLDSNSKVEPDKDSTSILLEKTAQKSLSDVIPALDVSISESEKARLDSASPNGYFINQDIFDKISSDSARFCAEALRDNMKYNHKATKSSDNLRNLDKPRAGVMRTVGDPQLQSTEMLMEKLNFDINFGPTFNYASSKNSGLLNGFLGSNNSKKIPSENNLHNDYSAGVINVKGNSELRDSITDDLEKPNTENRKLAWNPTLAGCVSSTTQQKSITPEDFVAQRNNIATMYVHRRFPSLDALRTVTKTPPLNGSRPKEIFNFSSHSRTCSSDFSVLSNHSRNYSNELLQRPSSISAVRALGPSGISRKFSNDQFSRPNHTQNASIDLTLRPRSRAASIILNSAGNGSNMVTSQLTAREQEHLAKVTGQPLISMATNGKNIPSAGLVAALEAREKDKSIVKQGLNSRAVEHVIQQRQQTQSQKHAYSASMDFQSQLQSPSILVKSGKIWAVTDPTKSTNLEHGRSMSSFSPSECYSPSGFRGRESIKFA